ncbi:MAG: hypothetical protein FJW39_02250 [Acidobacteria bacterium]|nr:hypothetical protein [Acidobacteriota bacterium]
MLECIQDGSTREAGKSRVLRGVAALSFRTTHVSGWRMSSGKLLIRRRGGTVRTVQVAAHPDPWREAGRIKVRRPEWRQAAVAEQGEGWVMIEVPGDLLQPLVDDQRRGILVKLPADWRVDSRESIHFKPYLFAEGIRQ